MTLKALKELFKRDLNLLKVEIESYKTYTKMWEIKSGIKNSAGNLSLHLTGNLNHFIGHGLLNNGYKRDRAFEFSCDYMKKEELLQQINDVITIVDDGLSQLSEDRLKADYPIQVWDKKVSTLFFLMHLHSHLTYHLGQINYHRRILDF